MGYWVMGCIPSPAAPSNNATACDMHPAHTCRHIRWDTETLGCMPSLSSIPSMEQRTLVDAMKEVKAWMDQPGNQEEFVVLFFDDQPDLTSWVSRCMLG